MRLMFSRLWEIGDWCAVVQDHAQELSLLRGYEAADSRARSRLHGLCGAKQLRQVFVSQVLLRVAPALRTASEPGQLSELRCWPPHKRAIHECGRPSRDFLQPEPTSTR